MYFDPQPALMSATVFVDDGLGCFQDMKKLMSMLSYLKQPFGVTSGDAAC
jgi:hypothetical protein